MPRTFDLLKKNHHKSAVRSYQPLSLSLDSSSISIQSYSDESFSSNSDRARRDHRFIKHSRSNQNGDHITSLKRRVRKQQIRSEQNPETTVRLPLSTNVYLMTYQQPSPSPYRMRKSSCAAPFPPLINYTRSVQWYIPGIDLNLYTYY